MSTPEEVLGEQSPAPTEGPASPPPADDSANALRSVHTSNLPRLLEHFGCSLAITTYQAGKLVLVRRDGETINTHFRTLRKPMGMAVGTDRLAIGTSQEIWEFRSVPAAAPRVEPAGKHDACLVPRRCHITGDIQIHEMQYVGTELWFVNTAFSCLCTLDAEHSFVPRWRPKFVNQYVPGDRCHLNGLATWEGRTKYVTALGETDTAGGWRENKKSGGILIDVETDEIVLRGLSMPHSPRIYAGRLWLLESGTGTLGWVDLEKGKYEPICELPGFTRGLDFVGGLAFVGLSQVRETAVFSGIAITERLSEAERTCGVYVVDLATGNVVAFLKFEEAVQEIFAVSILHGTQYPDVLTDDLVLIGTTYVLPQEALRDVPTELRSDLQLRPSESGDVVAEPGT